MERDAIIRLLRSRHQELTDTFGVKSLALFGSVARKEAKGQSDVDLLVEFDSRPIGLFHLYRTQRFLEELLDVEHVDLVVRHCVLDELKDSIYEEAIDVVG